MVTTRLLFVGSNITSFYLNKTISNEISLQSSSSISKFEPGIISLPVHTMKIPIDVASKPSSLKFYKQKFWQQRQFLSPNRVTICRPRGRPSSVTIHILVMLSPPLVTQEVALTTLWHL